MSISPLSAGTLPGAIMEDMIFISRQLKPSLQSARNTHLFLKRLTLLIQTGVTERQVVSENHLS